MLHGTAVGLVVSLALVFGCGTSVSDTGYVGTWRRTFGEHGHSDVAFWKAPDGQYRFRANRWGSDGTHELRCGAEGPCWEYGNGTEAFFEYTYRVAERAGETGLFVECEGHPRGSGDVSALHQIERFVVTPDGLGLDVRVVELNHVAAKTEIVRARFDKVSDDPFE